MCGIVGLYFKKKKFHNQLGKYLSGMLDNMSSRGPDSAGFAIYNNDAKKLYKYSLCINDNLIIDDFKIDISKKFKDVTFKIFGLSLATINILISLTLSVIIFKLFLNYEKN